MRILATGDTHGRIDGIKDIWDRLGRFDMILHTGDCYTDAIELERELGVSVCYVRGNCDGFFSSEICSTEGGDYAIVETECGRILLVHGHNERVNFGLDRLRYRALENDCVAAVFGHTHRAAVIEEDILYINPGSLSEPRDGSGGTCAIIETDEGGIDASLTFLRDI